MKKVDMDQNIKHNLLLNTNLVFLIWVICLIGIAVFWNIEDRTQGRNIKRPGINFKEF